MTGSSKPSIGSGSAGYKRRVLRELVRGDRFTRWTVLRQSSRGTRGKSHRARVLVRCVCGHECVVWVQDLRHLRSRGCDSKLCSARWTAAEAIKLHVRATISAVHEADALVAKLDRWLVDARAADLQPKDEDAYLGEELEHA